MGIVVVFFVVIAILHSVASAAMSQEMVNVIVPSQHSPIKTSSGVYGSVQCTKNSDETYAVCASDSNIAIKYNLQPFSFAGKGPNQGNNMWSCDLFETASQSTSRAVCAKNGSPGIVYFHRVSDMINVTNVTFGLTNNYPRVIVDTPNQVAYISNHYYSPAVYKITNIGSSNPIVAGNVTYFGAGNDYPAAMLIVDGFLYVHFSKDPARLARVNIATFRWNQTVMFESGEDGGQNDNLANENNFIYDLTANGFLVRCTYKNNNFVRFDSLNTGLSDTLSLAISPDASFLVFTAEYAGIFRINISTFIIDSRALLQNPTSSGYNIAFGRPIILSDNSKNTFRVGAFIRSSDYIFPFNFSLVPFQERYPTIYPLPSSPVKTSSGVVGSLQCAKNSDESYAVCASNPSDTAIKYNLQPFSFAAKGLNQGNFMQSCDLYDSYSQSTSRAVCVKGTYGTDGVVYFHRVSDMINVTNVTIGFTGDSPQLTVDTANQVTYVSNFYDDNTPPAIYKITNIGSSTPIVAGSLTSIGSNEFSAAALLVVDGFLYVHFASGPASRLARIDVSTFTWNETVDFESGEFYGGFDNLANDDNFIYDLTQDGILVRCTYRNNNFSRFDSLDTGFTNTYSLAISPDNRTLFVASQDNSLLQMVDVASFTKFGNTVDVPSALGRPIVLSSSRYVYAFGQRSPSICAFLYSNLEHGNTTLNETSSPSVTSPKTMSSSFSELHSSLSPSLSETLSAGVRVASETATLVDIPRFFIQRISQPVASALVASDATQAIAVVSVAVLGSISSSPVLGFNVGRQQAMTNFAKKSLEGDCRGLLPATTVNEFEEHISNPLGLGDSPTQMSIGGSEKLMSYYVGAVVGDFILTFGLVLLSQGIGMAVMKYFENKKNNNSNFGKLVRERMGKKSKNNKETTFEMMRRVFATSYVSLTLFFCLSFLLTPILSSSLIVLVAAMNDPKLQDHEVGVGLKIICVILAVVFCAVAVYFVMWSVLVRKQRKEKYRMLKNETEPSLPAKFFKAEGEWCYPNPTSSPQQSLSNLMKNSRNNKNESRNQRQFNLANHNFLIAEPTFESYRDTIWFCLVEIVSAILLAFPPFFAQFSSSAKGSCLVQGIMLLIIQFVYTILLMWKNPFKLRVLRIMNPVLALQQLIIVLISLIIVATRSNNDEAESPAWLWKILIVPLACQGAMSFLMVGAAFFPFVMFLTKLKGRMSRNQGQSEHKDRDLRGRNTSRSGERRENSVEMLPKVKNEKSSSSKRDHRDNNHRADGGRRNNKHHSSRMFEHDNTPSAIPGNKNKNNNKNDSKNNDNGDRHQHHRHENPGRNISDERETRRSSRSNNDSSEQRERERCAETLNISTSLLSPRRDGNSHSREQSRDKVTSNNTDRKR